MLSCSVSAVFVQSLFDEADGNQSGRLEGDEIADLIVMLHQRAGKRIDNKVPKPPDALYAMSVSI